MRKPAMPPQERAASCGHSRRPAECDRTRRQSAASAPAHSRPQSSTGAFPCTTTRPHHQTAPATAVPDPPQPSPASSARAARDGAGAAGETRHPPSLAPRPSSMRARSPTSSRATTNAADSIHRRCARPRRASAAPGVSEEAEGTVFRLPVREQKPFSAPRTAAAPRRLAGEGGRWGSALRSHPPCSSAFASVPPQLG